MSLAMLPDRWRQISHLYHAAMAREGDRAAFLEEACAGDEALRPDVESLLARPGSGSPTSCAAMTKAGSARNASTVGDPDPVDAHW